MNYATIYLGVGTVETVGLWCDTCNLPSRVMVPLVCLSDKGVAPFGHFSACTECDVDDD